MSKKDIIKKALTFNVNEEDILAIPIYTTTFHIHLFNMLVLLLYNFVLQKKMATKNIFQFIMQYFNEILDTTITELECALLHFCNMYEEELAEEVELNNKDETMLILVIQDKVNKKFKENMED